MAQLLVQPAMPDCAAGHEVHTGHHEQQRQRPGQGRGGTGQPRLPQRGPTGCAPPVPPKWCSPPTELTSHCFLSLRWVRQASVKWPARARRREGPGCQVQVPSAWWSLVAEPPRERRRFDEDWAGDGASSCSASAQDQVGAPAPGPRTGAQPRRTRHRNHHGSTGLFVAGSGTAAMTTGDPRRLRKVHNLAARTNASTSNCLPSTEWRCSAGQGLVAEQPQSMSDVSTCGPHVLSRALKPT